MSGKSIKKSIACVLAIATIGTGYMIPVTPVISNNGIIVNAATDNIKTKGNYKYQSVNGGVKFLGYADNTYDKDDNEITHYPSTGTMKIPASIDGSTVVAIGKLENVYDYIDECTAIEIPSTIKTIDDEVFSDFYKVKSIIFKGTAIQSIGKYAFSGCYNLTEINFNNSMQLTIGISAFDGCSKLKSIKAGKGGVIIKENAFSNLDSLETVDLNIDAADTIIGNYAFSESSIKKVVLPKNTTSIGNGAFNECNKLAEVNLGQLNKLTTLAENVFYGTALKEIVIPSGVTLIKNGAFANIVNRDMYDDIVLSKLTFNNLGAKIKCSISAFDGCNIDSVTIPSKMYNTKVGVLSIETFGNVHNTIKINSKTLKVTGIGDIYNNNEEELNVISPFGSYIWACINRTKYLASENGIPSYIKFKGEFEDNNGTNAKYTFTSVTLNEMTSNNADGVNVKYTTPIAKSDVKNGTGAKDLVVTVNTGVTTWNLNSVSLVKKLFTYSDKIATNGLSGTFVISNKSNTGIKLSSEINKKYEIQVENFDDANVTLDYNTDEKRGIYNKENACYIASTESANIKPTVIVKIGSKIVDSKYYTITYKNNTGIRANNSASLTVALNDEGKKLYNTTKTLTKKFTIKMDINKVKIGVTTFINQGNVTVNDTPGILTDDPEKSAFKSVSVGDESVTKIKADGKFVCTVKLNNDSKASVINNENNKLKLKLTYNDDNFFVHSDDLGQGVPVGVVKAKLVVEKDSPYFFGERDIEYYTKFNISKYDNIKAVKGENTTKAIKKTVNNINYWQFDRAYNYNGEAITAGSITLSMNNNLAVKELPIQMYTVNYSKNVNISKTETTSDMAYAIISSSSNQKYLFGERKIYFKINPTSVSNNMFKNIADQVYTGSKITPKLSGSYGARGLIAGTDYTVTYSDNIYPGTAKVTITGKGNFNGSFSKTFNIVKANLANCTVKWNYDRVSWRFGLDVKPVPEVYYNGELLTRGVDYNVTYLGKYVSSGKYDGKTIKNVGEVGGIAVVPTDCSKKISSSTIALSTATYGTTTVAGIIKNYTIDKLDLNNVDFTYPDSLVSDEYTQFKANLIPSIVVNGQVIKAYQWSTVRNIIADYKKISIIEATKYIPVDNSVVAYYGYETNSGNGFEIIGKMVREVDKYNIKKGVTNNNYYLIQDKLYMKDSKGNMTQVSKFYYTTDYDNANPGDVTDGMGIKVMNQTYNVNGVASMRKDVVKPGIIHAYTTGSVENESRYMLSNDNTTGYEHAWDIYVRPASTGVRTNEYEIQDAKPGTLNVKFTPSTADTFNGNIAYEIALFNTKADAINYTNIVKKYSIKYNSNDSTASSNGLTVAKSVVKGKYILNYDYMISGISLGKLYYVNIKAIDNKTKAESPIYKYPHQYYTTTSRAEIKSAYYEQNKDNDRNYNLHVDLSLPSHVSGTSNSKTSISDIFYEVEIRTSSNNILTTYRVSENGKIDKKSSLKLTKNANGTYGVTFENVPGMNDKSNYYVTVRTYLYFIVGNYTSNTFKFECTKNEKGMKVGTASVQAYNKNNGSVALATDKTIVAGNSIKATATIAGVWKNQPTSCTFNLYNENGKLVFTSGEVKAKNAIATYTIEKDKFKNTKENSVVYKLEVVATGSTADISKYTYKAVSEITVNPSITNNTTVNIEADANGIRTINKSGKINITMKANSSYSDVNIYNLSVKYFGNKSTFAESDVISSNKIFSGVQKANNSVYELGGSVFSEIGYYKIIVTASDTNETGVSKSFKIKVVNEPVNTSKAAVVTGYMDDGIQVDCSASLLQGTKFKIQVYNKASNVCIYDKEHSDSIVNIDISKIHGVKSGDSYYVIVTAFGEYNKKSYTLKSGKLNVGALTCTSLVNTSVIDKTEALQGAGEKIVITPSSKYGPVGNVEYTLELENINTGNKINYSLSNNKFTINVDEKKNSKYVLSTGSYVARVSANKGNEKAVQEMYISIKNENEFIKYIKFEVPEEGITPKLIVGNNNNKGLLIVNKELITTVKTNGAADVKFEYKRSVNSKWLEKTSSSESEFVFKLEPTAVASYDLRITVTMANGRVITKTYTNVGAKQND